MGARYDFDELRKHTTAIRVVTERLTAQDLLRDGLRDFSDFIDKLEAQPASILRNVLLLIACRFFNHVYS
jgi:hypothetical protein